METRCFKGEDLVRLAAPGWRQRMGRVKPGFDEFVKSLHPVLLARSRPTLISIERMPSVCAGRQASTAGDRINAAACGYGRVLLISFVYTLGMRRLG
jgi:hypothetical protein